MDITQFLSLPSDAFEISDGNGLVNRPNPLTHPGFVLSAAAHQEGERRRELILGTAISLEERYRTLLPPKLIGQREAASHESSEIEIDEEEEAEREEDEDGRSQSEENDAMNEDDDDMSEPPSPTAPPAKLKAAKLSHIGPSVSRRTRTRTSTPSSDVDIRLPREGVFDHDSASAKFVLQQRRATRNIQSAAQRPPPISTAPIASSNRPASFSPVTKTYIQHSVQPPTTTIDMSSLGMLYGLLAAAQSGQLQGSSVERTSAAITSAWNDTLRTYQDISSRFQGPPFNPNTQEARPRTFALSGGRASESSSVPAADPDEMSTTEDDVQPPPYSPVPEIPREKATPAFTLGGHSEYDFEHSRRYRAKDTSGTVSVVGDSLASRSSVPRTTSSIDGRYERRQSTPATASSSMLFDASAESSNKGLRDFLGSDLVGDLASYEAILTPTGREKGWKAHIIAISRHNNEPGRRMGRTPSKAFGYDPPMAEFGPGVPIEDFDLPLWLLQDVALWRAEHYEGSDCSPLIRQHELKEQEPSYGKDEQDVFSEGFDDSTMKERMTRRRR